ncbi:MAG TPA: DUF1987 domain-containing protein [Bacteroidia bacterium]|jgi:hypothetical protein
MEFLIIEPSIDTPAVSMDAEKGHIEISGKSYPEDTLEFYAPILQWMNDYVENPRPSSKLVFKLIYFNSSSYKPIFDLIRKMDELRQKNMAVTVEWHCKGGDTDMKEIGQELAEIANISFDYYSF